MPFLLPVSAREKSTGVGLPPRVCFALHSFLFIDFVQKETKLLMSLNINAHCILSKNWWHMPGLCQKSSKKVGRIPIWAQNMTGIWRNRRFEKLLSKGTTPRRFTLKIGFQEFQLFAILASHFVAKLLFWGLEAGPKGVWYMPPIAGSELRFVWVKAKKARWNPSGLKNRMVARTRIELVTHGFSIRCSTNWATPPQDE